MVKTIRKTIQITTRKRNNSVKINEEFYSYDKKNAQFEFLMDYDVPADKVIALFHFENSNRYYETLCQFKGNLITIEFDTSLIVEDELVTGYLYFDKLDKSTDVYRFTFGVRLSEIDKTRELPVQEKGSRRIVPIEDIATKTDVAEMLKSLRIDNGTVDNDKIESLINSKVNDRLGWIGEQLLSHNSFQQNQGKTNNDIFRTIEEIKERFNNLSNIYLSSHQSLDHLASKDALDKIEQRVEQLEQNRGNNPTVDTSNFVTRKELEDKHYLTSVPEEYAKTTDLTNFATNTKVEAVESRVQVLENKPNAIPQGYDDSGLKKRITNLENRPQVDLTDYAKKSEIPTTTNFATTDSVNNLLRAQGEQATKISALENKSAYEIHGTGMPNGQVEAPIGTTYVDMNVTNGALKWIKQSGAGNTGWKVLIGDTGWRTLNSTSKLIDGSRTSTIKIRRVNNLVTYNFGGLQWGWFGIVRRNGKGFVRHNSSGDKGAKVLGIGGIPLGFRSEASLIGGIYNDAGKPYGIWYLGGATDSNFIQFTFNDPIPTDRDIGDIRVSAISYLTDDDWPTTLP